MSVFLFFQKQIEALASIKEVFHTPKSLKEALNLQRQLNYPSLSSVFFQISPVKTTVNSIKNISFSKGEGFFTYSFNKSPRYIKTRINRTLKPLLISLSSSYLTLFILSVFVFSENLKLTSKLRDQIVQQYHLKTIYSKLQDSLSFSFKELRNTPIANSKLIKSFKQVHV